MINVKINEYSLPSSKSGPYGMTLGPDQEVWFTEYKANKIGKITLEGEVTEYNIPTSNSGPFGITLGSDEANWFAEEADKIGQLIY